MKRLKLLLILGVLVGAGIGASRMLHPDATALAAGGQGGQQAMPVPVIVMKQTPVQIWKSFPGRLHAVDSVDVRPQVSGTIKKIQFEDGQTVKAGEVLFIIDPRPYEAEAAQAKADLQGARNQSELAEKELKRAEELMPTGAIPKRVYDERLSNQLVAKSSIASAEARLKRAQLNIDYAHVKAPITGRVSRAEITEGNLIESGPNAPVLTTIVSADGIFADFEVDEKTYLQYVRNTVKDHEGERKIPVKLSLQSDPDAAFDGKIQSFDNKIDTASGTIRARAYFSNEDGTLLPGMYVTVRIGSPENKTSMVVPIRAVSTDQDRKFVYVVSPESKVAYREVTLGDNIGDSRIVLSGLKEGDQVIIDGLMKLRPDVPVTPQIQEAAPAQEVAPAVTTEDAPETAPEKKLEQTPEATPEDSTEEKPAEPPAEELLEEQDHKE